MVCKVTIGGGELVTVVSSNVGYCNAMEFIIAQITIPNVRLDV